MFGHVPGLLFGGPGPDFHALFGLKFGGSAPHAFSRRQLGREGAAGAVDSRKASSGERLPAASQELWLPLRLKNERMDQKCF